MWLTSWFILLAPFFPLFLLTLWWILLRNCKIQDAGTRRYSVGPFDGHVTCSPVPRAYYHNHISGDANVHPPLHRYLQRAQEKEKKKRKKKRKEKRKEKDKEKELDYFVCKVLWPQYPYSCQLCLPSNTDRFSWCFPVLYWISCLWPPFRIPYPAATKLLAPGCPADDHHKSLRHWLVFVLSSAFLFVLVPCVPWMTHSVSGENPSLQSDLVAHWLRRKYILVCYANPGKARALKTWQCGLINLLFSEVQCQCLLTLCIKLQCSLSLFLPIGCIFRYKLLVLSFLPLFFSSGNRSICHCPGWTLQL